MFHWLMGLSRRFEVELVCLDEAADRALPAELLELCSELSVFAPRSVAAGPHLARAAGGSAVHRSVELERHVHERAAELDLVVAVGIGMAFAAARAVPPGRGPVLALDLPSAEQEAVFPTALTDRNVVRRFYQSLDVARFEREEIAIAQRFDVITVPSRRDAEQLRAQVPPGRIEVLPNGVESRRFEEVQGRADSADLLFVGGAQEGPKEQGLRWFHRDVLPLIVDARPGTTVAVVGGHPGPALRALDRPDFQILRGAEEIEPWLASAKVCIVPRLSGLPARRTILAAGAAGCPVVSTSLGAEGLDFKDCQELIIADQPERFAAGCLQLLTELEEAANLAARARAKVKARYEWSGLGARFAATLERRCDWSEPSEVSG